MKNINKINITRRSSQTTKYASKCFPDNFPSFNGGASTRFKSGATSRIFRARWGIRSLALECRLNFNFGGSPSLGRRITRPRKRGRMTTRGAQARWTTFEICTACRLLVALEQRASECWNASLRPDVRRGRSYDIQHLFLFIPRSSLRPQSAGKLAWIFI